MMIHYYLLISIATALAVYLINYTEVYIETRKNTARYVADYDDNPFTDEFLHGMGHVLFIALTAYDAFILLICAAGLDKIINIYF